MNLKSTLALVALAAGPAAAQMEFSGIYTRDVKQAISVSSNLDTVLVDTKVAGGLAQTMVTLVITPQEALQYSWQPRLQPGQRLDSIEITFSFNLPSDWVARNMYLWVNGERQTAYIQDKNLARQQYEQIVGKRKDPALLETWGNGSYNLHIFPAKVGASRKIEIEFQHTFDDDTLNIIAARLPFSVDSSRHYYYWNSDGKSAFTISYFRLTASTSDSKLYGLTMDGLGSASFSAASRPAVLEAKKVAYLKPGLVWTGDPSGKDEYFWSGKDKYSRLTAGCATVLAESLLTLEPEPSTRIIVIDVRQQYWDWNTYYKTMYEARGYTFKPYQGYKMVDIWLRAQKMAVLALQNYVKDGQSFNVVFAGETPRAVFAQPVARSAESIGAACQAIVAAKPEPRADTRSALRLANAQAKGEAVVLISDLYEPATYWFVDKNRAWTASKTGADYDTLLARIRDEVRASDMTLFTIADEYRLSTIAQSSGGYNLTSLHWDYYYNFVKSDGVTRYVVSLPPLYKGRSGYSGGITDLKVEAAGLNNLVWTFASPRYAYYYDAMPGIRGGVLAKSAIVMPYQSARALGTLRLAGQVPAERGATTVSATIRGKCSGLGFTKVLAGSIDVQGADAVAVQWAFVKSEYLAAQDLYGNAADVKAVGKEYHIVTRQTSLLALEPGMELWVDTTDQNQNDQNGGEKAGASFDAAPSAIRTTEASGNSLDSASLDELIKGSLPVGRVLSAQGARALDIFVKGSTIALALPELSAGAEVKLSLLDLQGRLVARRALAGSDVASGRFVWNLAGAASTNGYYLLKVRLGGAERSFKVPLAF